MQTCMGSTVPKFLDVVYKAPNERGIVLNLRLALPAGPTFRGSRTSVDASANGTSQGGVKILPKVECPNHKTLLQYLSSY